MPMNEDKTIQYDNSWNSCNVWPPSWRLVNPQLWVKILDTTDVLLVHHDPAIGLGVSM